MTVKRKRDDGESVSQVQPLKRSRTSKHQLLSFTDEIVLRILSFLDVGDLIVVQRVSQRLQKLSVDSSIWRGKYYDRWVHPRMRRSPGGKANAELRYSSKLAKWLNQHHALREEEKVNWKRQYKIRANWWRGKCKMQELDLTTPPAPQVLVQIHSQHRLMFTADEERGLRVWSRNLRNEALAEHPFPKTTPARKPTALAVDAASGPRNLILVGFSDGSFDVHSYTLPEKIQLLHTQKPQTPSTTSACAISFPYVLTLSDGKTMTLYQLHTPEIAATSVQTTCESLTSLTAEVAYSPVSLSIRQNAGGLVACVAYAFCRLNLGWSLGLQEVRLNPQGGLLDCRLAATQDQSEEGLASATLLTGLRTTTRSAFSQTFALHPNLMNRPSSISYSHPYLTASLPDNTLVVYLVTSDSSALDISAGRRLWGHTSSISGVEVDARGKAVSISTKGNETRVWDLEEILGSNSQKRSSIRINPVQDLSVLTQALAKRSGFPICGQDELAITRRWVGFDDEQVLVLGEEPSRRQILSCYDFT